MLTAQPESPESDWEIWADQDNERGGHVRNRGALRDVRVAGSSPDRHEKRNEAKSAKLEARRPRSLPNNATTQEPPRRGLRPKNQQRSVAYLGSPDSATMRTTSPHSNKYRIGGADRSLCTSGWCWQRILWRHGECPGADAAQRVHSFQSASK